MKRRFFICSVGRPGDGYDEENLKRCIDNNGHFMHQDTQHKGVFDEVSKNDVTILKYNDKFVAYGLVNRTDSSDNVKLKDWNYAIYVDRWFFFDEQQKENGINRNGVQEAVVKGDQYATIKEIKQEFALEKIEEIKKDTELFKTLKQEFEMGTNVIDICNLLEANHNLILTGAPGTGKTYLAKQIAKAMGCSENEIGFVQFHPSYDYTDFVEGLRPKQDDNGNVVFERKDGVFKKFCKKAISSQKQNNVDNFNEVWDRLVNSLNENDSIDIPFISNKSKTFRVELNEYGTGLANRTYQNDDYQKGEWIKGQSKFFSKEQLYNIYRGMSGVPSGGHDNYRKAVVNYMKENLGLKNYQAGTIIKNKASFVFIIDEINRGEISKIFGELFFSIDPGYRGTDGKVKTQYQNLIEEDDEFFDGFYVPENVYIIGTMNDIDRSVESMDFAFRRRFAFKEVTAEDSQEMLDNENAWKDSNGNSLKPDDKTIELIKGKMESLNKMIWHEEKENEKEEDKCIEGLSSAYHIGASYFLKLKNYDGDFNQLWEYHLEGLLHEYLRGMQGVEDSMKKLKNAYDNANPSNGQ